MQDNEATILALIAAERDKQGALLPILRSLQQRFGFISTEAIALVARELNLSRAEVHGVVGFYDDFSVGAPGKATIKLCGAEACQALGSRELLGQLQADGEVEAQTVYCLGLCALGPAALIGDQPLARADADKLRSYLSQAQLETITAPESPARVKFYLSCDSNAAALGADAVAERLAELYPEAELLRTGSHGFAWLEPLLELESDGERIAFGNMTPELCTQLVKAGKANAGHSQHLGATSALPYWNQQERLVFAHCGWVPPLDYDGWLAHGGGAGWQAAQALSAQQIVDAVKASGLRGRGGAGFPTGIKWQTVLDAPGAEKYIVVNADEGDSGTFADRMLMEGDPFTLLEGMRIAGRATGAQRGYIYLRSEYPVAEKYLTQAIAVAEQHGLLAAAGAEGFRVELRVGAGAYICGEETSLLESLEGKRGTIRYKPPLPALEGFYGQPTVVNNVISIASVPAILARGADYHADLGVGKSRGTLTLQLAGNVARGGLYEVPFGLSLASVIYDIGGGTLSGRPVRAVQVGGPLGAYLRADQLDLPLDYEAFAAQGFMIGHGGVVVFDEQVNMAAQARFAMEFCAHESCGKCTPCRIGSTRGAELVAAIERGERPEHYSQVLRELCDTMTNTSLCALGGLTPAPVLSALNSFPEDFGLIARS